MRVATHPLINIVTIGICAVICGVDDFTGMEDFGNRKKEWLSKFLDLSEGIPSHDTFNTVLGSLNPRQFEQCLLRWIASLHEISDGELVAIDGKTLRRSYDRRAPKLRFIWSAPGRQRITSVSARCAWMRKATKSRQFPSCWSWSKSAVRLSPLTPWDAKRRLPKRSSRKRTLHPCRERHQPKLSDAIRAHFEDHLADDFARIKVSRHRTLRRRTIMVARKERDYFVTPLPDDFPEAAAGRICVHLESRSTTQYAMESRAPRFATIFWINTSRRNALAVLREDHWSIENNLHWQLDVTFGEDASRIRKRNGAANMSILRRTALSMLKNETSFKRGIKGNESPPHSMKPTLKKYCSHNDLTPDCPG